MILGAPGRWTGLCELGLVLRALCDPTQLPVGQSGYARLRPHPGLDDQTGPADRWDVELNTLLPVAHAAATLFMAGLIWFVQIVHYPLFGRVGAAESAAYGREHARRTGWVAGPAMLVELVLALALAARGGALAWAGLALLGVIWASTALVQVPLHRRLAAGPDPAARLQLVRTNWIRTAAWTARAVLASAAAVP
jgi:hypothetical protein